MADERGDEPPDGTKKRPKVQLKLTDFIKKQRKNDHSSEFSSCNSPSTSSAGLHEETTSSRNSAEEFVSTEDVEFDSSNDAIESSETQVMGRGMPHMITNKLESHLERSRKPSRVRLGCA